MKPKRAAIALLCALVMGTVAPAPVGRAAAAELDKKPKKLDTIWVHPDFAAFEVKSIAMLPTASFDNDLKTEKDVEIAWAQAFKASGYRWYTTALVKDLLKSAFGGDSVLTALRAGLLKEPRVDSLAAPKLCRALHASAVLSVRADLWEQVQMEWNQTGKPWTTVQLRAALVDSAGRLLWSASGSETSEGPLHSPESQTLGVKSSGLNLQPLTAQGGAPSYQETLAMLFSRWVERFPARSVSPAPGGGP